jgi:hypothetical protein
MKSRRMELVSQASSMRDVFEILSRTLERKIVQKRLWSRQRYLYKNKIDSSVIGCEGAASIQLIREGVH